MSEIMVCVCQNNDMYMANEVCRTPPLPTESSAFIHASRHPIKQNACNKKLHQVTNTELKFKVAILCNYL